MAFIEIIGIMGSGKTSLAKMFNEKAGFNDLIEINFLCWIAFNL